MKANSKSSTDSATRFSKQNGLMRYFAFKMKAKREKLRKKS